MSLTAIVRALAAAGATPDQIAAAVEAAEASTIAPVEERRRKERDKKRRRRQLMPESEWQRVRRLVFARDGEVCQYCRSRSGPFHIDHIVPLSRGGTHELGNLAVACHACNSSKSGKLMSEWMR